jgi:hypothetical protein
MGSVTKENILNIRFREIARLWCGIRSPELQGPTNSRFAQRFKFARQLATKPYLGKCRFRDIDMVTKSETIGSSRVCRYICHNVDITI